MVDVILRCVFTEGLIGATGCLVRTLDLQGI